ncbi:HIT domain-containing protein [Alphaproteobacteria bacterium]|jgi:diadenosine tetraphosphate (Ap4A) HIT family hydrolase|nr:HIT domain-containing protein [Alphaproteobacteria bacterium]
MTFKLHDDLIQTCIEVQRFPLCRVLLNNDSNYPWIILVPERTDIEEIHELCAYDRSILIEEIAAVSAAMSSEFNADKINIGALGNATPQLHIHVIVRFKTDPAGLGPVWNASAAQPYTGAPLDAMLNRLRKAFAKTAYSTPPQSQRIDPGIR